MTPTLGGRLQTRLVLSSSFGLLWTVIVCPVLPRPDSMSLGLAFRVTLLSGIATTLLGILWEFTYHGLQQLRWDKDWPTMLGLVTGVLEIVPVWLVLHALGLYRGDPGLSSPILPLFVSHFVTTWLVVWSVSHGLIQIIQPRWRFEGGAFSKRPHEALMTFIVTNIGMVFSLVLLWSVWR